MASRAAEGKHKVSLCPLGLMFLQEEYQLLLTGRLAQLAASGHQLKQGAQPTTGRGEKGFKSGGQVSWLGKGFVDQHEAHVTGFWS